MCGKVFKRTRMTNINCVLEALEAALPKLKGKLGRVVRDQQTGKVKGSHGYLAESKHFQPEKGIPVSMRGGEVRQCQVVIPEAAFKGAFGEGNYTGDLALSYDEGSGTWGFVTYARNDIESDVFGKAFRSKVFLEYASEEFKQQILQPLGGQVEAVEEVKVGGNKARVVTWSYEQQEEAQ